ncbi:DUF4937 domain-containing protein [Actinoplanes regularis]|uniref:DUF4937 domain-containing protein n=1 Tax=Actinoplanes regularis TaxID=52697 RepID=A0A238Y7K9_9ACTN|nr:DUF4937 domain-containing protein [Actinoplanes regularis]GIE86175.1 DUF4937 domain-containing protein [Actinoplanes regularis]SNR66329.1 protein of unknown function [Actinoplanes regularis]
MTVKWITCWATDRAAFDLGQQAWAGLRGVPGFLGQCGGWSRRTAGVAQIFGFWSSRSSHEEFLNGTHDRLAAAQAGTFEEVRVRVLDQRLVIGSGLLAGLPAVSLLRLAHCHVRQGRAAHFIQTQAELWNPGMAGAPGMCGGVFAQNGESECLVLSGWRTADDHQLYLDERFGQRYEKAGLAADLDDVTGDLVDLDPTWTVIG